MTTPPGGQQQNSDEANQSRASRRRSTPAREGALRELSAAPRPAPLETVPQELLEKILDYVDVRHVARLATTSKTLRKAATPKLLAKAKASELTARANAIGYRDPAAIFEFFSILDSAFHPEIPLHGKDLSDVLIALTGRVHRLPGHDRSRAYDEMLAQAENKSLIGYGWVTADAPDKELPRPRVDDHTKGRIISILCGPLGLHQLGGDEIGHYFDRWASVLEGIREPEVQNRLVAEMVLAHWYYSHREQMGVARLRRLVKFVEDHRDHLSDEAKASAIKKLVYPALQHGEVADKEADFNSCVSIASSIEGEVLKAGAVFLLSEISASFSAEGVLRAADRELKQILATISDDAKTRAKEEDPMETDSDTESDTDSESGSVMDLS